MIKNISDILQKFMSEETEKLKSFNIKHAPTIGKMYEGLTANILEKTFPSSLKLQVIGGMIHDGYGKISGEIDCMLVKGEGEQIPYTNSYKWHAKDVIAIFEVKKNLYADNLQDSFEHLRDAIKVYHSYIENTNSSHAFMNVEPAKRAFKEISGRAPVFTPHEGDLPLESIYHTLVMEQVSPIRIVVGYNSYKSEYKMREALNEYLFGKQMTRGFGIGSFPQLMICGDYSLVKLNGQPYSSIMQDDYWDFYASSNENPLLLLLELIWTKLTNEFDVSFPWGEDLNDENLARLLAGKIKHQGDVVGWDYKYIDVPDHFLQNRAPRKLWEPLFVDADQFAVFKVLCKKGSINIKEDDFIDFLLESNLDRDEFIESLMKTGLLVLHLNELTLSTYECRCAILPDGRYAVAEDDSGRFTRWINVNFVNDGA